MIADLIEANDARLWMAATDGPALGSDGDAVDLIGDALSAGACVIAVPAGRFGPDFWRLRTGLAGAFIQKIVTYRLKLAIVGDISVFTDKSQPLRDFVRESNRGTAVWFVPDLAAVLKKLD